jgi:RNA polymerase sigma-70 factor (ECF subfamily)
MNSTMSYTDRTTSVESKKVQNNTSTKKRDDEWTERLERIAVHRDRKAFAEIFAHFGPLIKGFARFETADNDGQQLAEELVQEVMIKVWNKASSFDSTKSAATTWIYTMARNTKIDMLRRINRQPTQTLDADDYWHPVDEETPVSNLIRRRIKDVIQESLAQLPPEQCDVLRKIYLEGKSQSEVSEDMNLPLGTVKSRVRRALDKLQVMVAR